MSQHTGIEVVDLGLAQLSMHSVREMMGEGDLLHGYRLLQRFFR